MLDYMNKVLRGFRDQHNFEPREGSASSGNAVFEPGTIPPGEYPMVIDGKIDYVKLGDDDKLYVCRFKDDEQVKDEVQKTLWVIVAPGNSYLSTQECANFSQRVYAFCWDKRPSEALLFVSKDQATIMYNCIRELANHLFTFEKIEGMSKCSIIEYPSG